MSCKITQGYVTIRKFSINETRNEKRKKKIIRLFLTKEGIK